MILVSGIMPWKLINPLNYWYFNYEFKLCTLVWMQYYCRCECFTPDWDSWWCLKSIAFYTIILYTFHDHLKLLLLLKISNHYYFQFTLLTQVYYFVITMCWRFYYDDILILIWLYFDLINQKFWLYHDCIVMSLWFVIWFYVNFIPSLSIRCFIIAIFYLELNILCLKIL